MANVMTMLCRVCQSPIADSEPAWKFASGVICAKCIECVLRQSPKIKCEDCRKFVGSGPAARFAKERGYCNRETTGAGVYADAYGCPDYEKRLDWADEIAEEIAAWEVKNAGCVGRSFKKEWADIIRKHAPKEVKP